MTDYDLILGLKTKACVNGITPETIPSIEGSIEDMNTTLEELGTTVEGVADDVGDNTTAIGGLDTRITAIENEMGNDDWIIYTGTLNTLFSVINHYIIPRQDFVLRINYSSPRLCPVYSFYKDVPVYDIFDNLTAYILSSSPGHIYYFKLYLAVNGCGFNNKTDVAVRGDDTDGWNIISISSRSVISLTRQTTETTSDGFTIYVKGNNESE